MNKKVVVEMLYGLGGAVTSDGIVELVREIQKIPNVAVPVPFDQASWQLAVANVKKWTVGEKIVLIGYSMGANNITYMAQALQPRPIELMIAIQPTLWSPAVPITGNVKKVFLINNPGPLGWLITQGLGSRMLTTAKDFKGTFKHIVDRDVHMLADNDSDTHKLILSEIQKLVV